MVLYKKLISFFVRFFYRKVFSKTNTPQINGWSIFKGNISLGKNNHFNGAKLYGQGDIKIGDNFHSASGLIILTQNHNWKGTALPYDSTVEYKPVNIGDNVWVGLNVLILPGVAIGEGVIVQAGSVVSMSIPDCAIVGGNPAKIIKYRDIEHYGKLKNNECFH